jgi:hypothetical protein
MIYNHLSPINLSTMTIIFASFSIVVFKLNSSHFLRRGSHVAIEQDFTAIQKETRKN